MNSMEWSRRRFLSSVITLAGLSLSRPSNIRASAILSAQGTTCLSSSWMDGGRLPVEGYANRRSYAPGELVTLFLSSPSRTRATVTIERLGAKTERVWSAPVWVSPMAIPVDASEHGCRWEGGEGGSLSFEIPSSWSTGFYRVAMSGSSGGHGRPGEALFVVRPPNPGWTSRILLCLTTNTYFAYNNYGAAQGSDTPSTRGSFYEQAELASFDRPLPSGFLSPYDCHSGDAPSRHQRYAGWDKWEWPFVQWAEREGFALDYATSEDLERHPALLSSYSLILSVGHDEYWSQGMRDTVDQFILRGGNAAFLSGNVCYRHVRLNVPESRLELTGPMDGTALWSHRHGANRPENLLTGVSFCYGALNPDPVPYKIYQPGHWVFDGVWPGSRKPKRRPEVGLIGYECDGCDIDWVNDAPVATHRDGTPENFQILGLAPGRMPEYEAVVHSKALFGRNDGYAPWGRDMRQGAAVLGLWTREGTVLTVGCTEWARQLDDPAVAQITRNILTRLSL